MPRNPIVRPIWHLTPLTGWMNDPCAPYQDFKTGVFHLWFQWVPSSTEWSRDIGWGYATSNDGVSWKQNALPALMPELDMDCAGVFTGSYDPRSGSKPIVIYSAINKLALDNTKYDRGQERLALAAADRYGNLVRFQDKPLQVFPPENITGWRDPFVFTSETINNARNATAGAYVLVSGGIQGSGPTIFLYALKDGVDAVSSLTSHWEYIGPFIEPTPRAIPPSSEWLGDRGDNWECGVFFENDGRNYLVLGSEGKWQDESLLNAPPTHGKVPSWTLWFSGDILSTGKMEIELEGVLDWGCLYALQIFRARNGRHLSQGWLIDNDLDEAGRAEQGWAGAMSMLREVFTQKIDGVLRGLAGPAGTATYPSFSFTPSEDVYIVQTMGVRPAVEIEARRGPEERINDNTPYGLSWEARIVVDVSDGRDFHMQVESEEGVATISFLPKQERIVIRRDQSTLRGLANTDADHGKHTLFYTTAGLETLQLRIFCDTSIIELFSNDRFALSTHLYTGPSRPRVPQETRVIEALIWTLCH